MESPKLSTFAMDDNFWTPDKDSKPRETMHREVSDAKA
jgi:hypothetical protein